MMSLWYEIAHTPHFSRKHIEMIIEKSVQKSIRQNEKIEHTNAFH